MGNNRGGDRVGINICVEPLDIIEGGEYIETEDYSEGLTEVEINRSFCFLFFAEHRKNPGFASNLNNTNQRIHREKQNKQRSNFKVFDVAGDGGTQNREERAHNESSTNNICFGTAKLVDEETIHKWRKDELKGVGILSKGEFGLVAESGSFRLYIQDDTLVVPLDESDGEVLHEDPGGSLLVRHWPLEEEFGVDFGGLFGDHRWDCLVFSAGGCGIWFITDY